MQAQLSPEEEKELVRLLARLQPGFQPFAVFREIARIVALPIVEVVPLRRGLHGVEVLLIKKQEEPFNGQWHTPGTVIRATDMNAASDGIWQPFARIFQDELQGVTVGPPYFVGLVGHKSSRGAEQAQVYWVEIGGEPAVGTFFAADRLPQSLIKSQRNFIRVAVESYVRATNESP